MKTLNEISKLIALVLRHKPEELGLKMDNHGWVETGALIEKINAIQPFTMEMLEEIVSTDNKQRYSLNQDKSLIRANQGHSIPVDLELLPAMPPKTLYHGTATRFSQSIEEKGLIPMQRQHVHLSDNLETAIIVGKRHGTPVVYEIDAEAMCKSGYVFYCSENGVWLVQAVPAKYLKRTELH
ncbi:MAG: RNA 2'-phosphotransferase [Clostridia bacterium]|nr:RNA 2'-phosphotransferase [Clostridia bacterium]